MPPVRADALHATGRQPRGSGQGLDCFGTSTALSCWPVLLALRRSGRCCLASTCWSGTDNTAAVSYINRQGCLRSRRMSQLACHLLLWSQTLRAVHILGKLNRAAEGLSRQLTFPGEWRLHPETIRLFWSRFGEAQVNLVVFQESSHGQLYDSLT